jgi:parvulin-like peptidyl-prolyl isomerase
MTFRAKPVSRRRGRAGWDSGDRRTALINGGFVAAIVVSILLLVGYAGFSWYTDHFGAAATVNGRTITRDEVRARVAVESFRLNYIESRIQTLMAKGRLDQSTGQQQIALIGQQRDSLGSLAIQRLVDVNLQAELANRDGVTVTDADVDAQLTSEATTLEQRHAWMIEVEPATSGSSGQVGDAAKAEAKAKAEQALVSIKSGKSWEEVAKTVSTSGNAASAGDIGWISDNVGYDEKWLAAVFATKPNEPTGVIEGSDGIFRIGRVTEIAPAEVDSGYQNEITDAGVSMDTYRQAVRADVVRTKLSDKVVADLSQPGAQRHVLQLHLPAQTPSSQGSETGVKVRHILFSPKNNPSGAKDLPADDPAWQAAKDEADAAYQALLKDPGQFDAMAREKSDEGAAIFTGGKLDWSYPSSSLDEAFKKAIFADGLKPGEILPPVKSTFGWHVIQFMRSNVEGDEVWIAKLKDQADKGADFSQLVRDNGEGDEVKDGGDLGWVAHNQLADQLDAAIFGTDVGKVSQSVAVTSDGFYLFKILAEETRTPTAAQIKIFKDSGFQAWYTREKAKATITYASGSPAGDA